MIDHTRHTPMKLNFTRLLICLSCLIGLPFLAASQAHLGMPYNFSRTFGGFTPTPPTSGLTTITSLTNQDEALSPVYAPAGFSFNFAGVVYDGFVVSSNGFIVLTKGLANLSVAPGTINPFPNNNLAAGASAAGLPLIAAEWDDLQAGAVTYLYSAPNLWVRFTATRWQSQNATGASNNQFYINLNTSTNTINIIFTSSAVGYVPVANPGNTISASMGIAGPCAGDFYAIKPRDFSTGDTTWTSFVEVDSVNDPLNYMQRRPNNMYFTFTPRAPQNDNCAAAIDLGPLTSTCTYQTFSNVHATASASGNVSCSPGGTDNNDVWFYVVKPVGVSDVRFTTIAQSCSFTNNITGTSIQAFSSCGGAPISCSTTNGASPWAQLDVTGRSSCIAETLYVRVTGDGNTAGKFQICAQNMAAGASGATCANPTRICSIPYSSGAQTTSGLANTYDTLNMACYSLWSTGQDHVFEYTATTTQCVSMTLTATSGTNPALFIFNGCPNVGNCLRIVESNTNTATVASLTFVAGQTYYIMVDNNSNGGSINFTLDITVAGATTNSICSNATSLGTLTSGQSCSWVTGFTTACATPSGIPSPGCSNFYAATTGDVWFSFNSGTYSGSVLINTRQSGVNPNMDGGMAIYGGTCPGGLGLLACDDNSGSNNMPSLTITVSASTTYYVRVWTSAPALAGSFDICLSTCVGASNDLPCGALTLPLGGTLVGDNTCATSGSEPGNSAQCTAGGTINTIWYTVTVPASGSVKIRTHPLSLQNTQIQAFTFPGGCGNPGAAVSYGCNDDGPACSGGTLNFYSDLTVARPPGTVLYIAVDGVGSATGTFEISAIDGAQTLFPPVQGQDCDFPTQVCGSSNITVANPGWQNFGNICDLPSAQSCWGVGERNSVWYQFTMNPGTLQFTVSTASGVDIDFLLWDVTSVASPCSLIRNNSLASASCNYAGAAATTGMQTGGTGAFSPSITFSGAPRTYLLLLNNWNSSTSAGYTLNWMGSPVSTTPSTVTWSGTTDSTFQTATNWGACGQVPACGIDAVVVSAARQPFIVSNQTVKNLTISAGSTLTLKAPNTLNICGSFSNFGTFIAEPGSTVNFIGNTNEFISGNIIGANAFANLTITKLSPGSVQLNTDIDVAGNFVTANSTSIFRMNGRYMKVAGNFTNNNGTTTFTNIGGSTVEFNGTANQFFTNTNGSISLNRVLMNKPSGKLYLSGANSIMNIDTALTMTNGIINTRSLAALEVNVKNPSNPAVNAGNANSYIDGRLRRKVFNNANLDFPLGDSAYAKGYQLANITWTSATVISDLQGQFTSWPGVWPNPGPTASECIIATYDALPIFNHGYWTFLRGASGGSNGTYNITLNNNNYSNSAGSNGWTVAAADTATNPLLSASWGLIGNCVISSTAAVTQRSGINVAPNFNRRYTTVQSTTPLPIELLSFDAQRKGMQTICNWETASETNNDYFELLRSDNAEQYEVIAKIPGYGHGTTTQPRSYSFTDKDACNNIRYYRLKQVDIDGTTSYSEVVSVRCKREGGDVSVYPNPAQNAITVSFYEDEDTEINLQIVDYTGRIVYEESLKSLRGTNFATLSLSNLAKGVYYIQLIDTGSGSGDVPRQVRILKN